MVKKTIRETYDYFELVKEVEKLSGRNPDDWSGRRLEESKRPDKYSTGDFPAAMWAKKMGYDWTVLNDPVDEDGMKLRVKINTEYQNSDEKKAEEEAFNVAFPYQRFWEYMLDNVFYELSNDSYHTFSPKSILEEVDDSNLWVKEVLGYFIRVFEANNMPDEVEVHVCW